MKNQTKTTNNIKFNITGNSCPTRANEETRSIRDEDAGPRFLQIYCARSYNSMCDLGQSKTANEEKNDSKVLSWRGCNIPRGQFSIKNHVLFNIGTNFLSTQTSSTHPPLTFDTSWPVEHLPTPLSSSLSMLWLFLTRTFLSNSTFRVLFTSKLNHTSALFY